MVREAGPAFLWKDQLVVTACNMPGRVYFERAMSEIWTNVASWKPFMETAGLWFIKAELHPYVGLFVWV